MEDQIANTRIANTMPGAPASAWDSAWAWLKSLPAKLSAVRQPRKLRLIENLPLGEKRFLALVEVAGRQILVGSTSTSISLIERLGANPPNAMEAAAGNTQSATQANIC